MALCKCTLQRFSKVVTCAHDYFINKLACTVARQDLKSD